MTGYACPICGMTTLRPEDVAERYCPWCHQFEDVTRAAVDAYEHGDLRREELERLTAGTGFTVPHIQRALGEGQGVDDDR